MEEPLDESKKTATHKHKLPVSSSAGEDGSSPPYFAGDDDFAWPEFSSSGELPNNNIVEITMCSVSSTPESTPTGAVSDEVSNLGFSEEMRKGKEKVDESPSPEKKEKDNEAVAVSGSSGGGKKEVRKKEVNLAGKASENRSKSSLTAMDCLVEVLKHLFDYEIKKMERMLIFWRL